ncbi:MAG: serine/threonine protein kinase, partial [Bryobacteraceae bacterium]
MIDRIGTYRILEVLHEGARPLYRAEAPDGRVVALKTSPLGDLADGEKDRFLCESAVCATFDHPNLVRVLDFGEAGGVLYQTTEVLEGRDFTRLGLLD